MNILKVQDTLKNLSDAQLAQEIRMPSGAAPQFLVMTEMQRRQKMRAAAQSTGEKPSIAEEMAGEAPPEQAMPPEGPPPQNAGIMGLPDATAAGNVMKARITGQPQQVGDMTAMPPQGMAEGGAVQFKNIFGGQSGPAMQPSSTPALVQQNYQPVNGYVPPATTDYSNFQHQFDGRPTPRTPNPRVRMSDAERYGIPKGMAAPTYGTPGLSRTYSGRDGQNIRYSFDNDAARDAYIRYMTPPSANNSAITSAMAAQNAVSTVPPRAMADGGPIRMGAGAPVNYGGESTSAFEDWRSRMGEGDIADAVRRVPIDQREDYINELLSRPQVTSLNPAGNPQYGQEMRGYLEKELERTRAQRDLNKKENVPPLLGSMFTPRGEVDRRTKNQNDLLAKIEGINQTPPSLYAPAQAAAPQAGAPQAGAPQAAPPQLDVNQNYDPDAPPPSLMPPVGGMAQPNLDFAALLASQAAAQPKARGSIAPPVKDLAKKEPAGQVGNEASPVQPKSKYEEMAMAKLEAMRGNDAEDRKNDINMALIQAGLGMASSKNPRFLAALAEGATPALSGYTDARRLAKKGEREFGATELGIMGNVENIRAQEATRAQSQGQFDTTAGLQREQLGLTRRQIDAQGGTAERADELARQTLQAQIDRNNMLPDSVREAQYYADPKNARELAVAQAMAGDKNAKAATALLSSLDLKVKNGDTLTESDIALRDKAMDYLGATFSPSGTVSKSPQQSLYAKVAQAMLAGRNQQEITAALKAQLKDATDAEIQGIIDNATALTQQQ
jgi:hypothetical protein